MKGIKRKAVEQKLGHCVGCRNNDSIFISVINLSLKKLCYMLPHRFEQDHFRKAIVRTLNHTVFLDAIFIYLLELGYFYSAILANDQPSVPFPGSIKFLLCESYICLIAKCSLHL